MPSFALLERHLRQSVDGEVRFDKGTLTVYSTDASNYRRVPVAVVIPRHEGDVANAVAIARENSLPILARGAGTSLAGQCANAAIVLDFSKYMTTIRAIDPERRIAVVEPGVVQAHLNAAVAAHGLFFGPDPATKDRCTIGGMIGNNACGPHSAAYGKTVDNLDELKLLLYDGSELKLASGGSDISQPNPTARRLELVEKLAQIRERYANLIRERYPKIPRRVSGYNLDELLPERGFHLARAVVGSEGTLGIVLEATLRLVARPSATALVVLGFEDIFRAADQVPWLLSHGPLALEGFDHHLVDFSRARGTQAAGLSLLPDGRAFLIAELGAASAEELSERAERLRDEARREGQCTGAAVVFDPAEQQALWRVRESGLGAGAFVAGHPRSWPGAEDAAVAPQRLGAFLRRFDALLKHHDLSAASYYGHFGEGCLHCRVNFDFATDAGVRTFRAAMTELAALVAEFGGSLSGEHGDGVARSELLPTIFGQELIEAFRAFKLAFDPEAKMNPGVIVDPNPLDSHLKLRAQTRPPEHGTYFDFSAEGGLAGAALKCVGIGKCRKTDAGTMCPSYMVTREEVHCTRGRARLLFEALAGDLLEGGLADPALADALDLCLACKACRSECPAAVDMAKYKAEARTSYFRASLRPLYSYLFGRIHEIARLASVAPQISNALAQSALGRAVAKGALGLHGERVLPPFAERTFRRWWRRRRAGSRQGRDVVLFADTFCNFFEPEVAMAAVEVLERAGCRVIVPQPDLCCGRPLYEQGMLGAARVRLARAVRGLGPYLQRGIPIVGLEPSCILTFRDELQAMFPSLESARALAERAMTLDEFLVSEVAGFEPPGLLRPALVHGHCHRKAIASMESELELLGRMKGLSVSAPDAGCCGMAGAFGYEGRHYEVSRAVGERVLLPAVRQSSPETLVIADGFSCRAQIRQFCPGREPLHLAQVLELAYRSADQAT